MWCVVVVWGEPAAGQKRGSGGSRPRGFKHVRGQPTGYDGTACRSVLRGDVLVCCAVLFVVALLFKKIYQNLIRFNIFVLISLQTE